MGIEKFIKVDNVLAKLREHCPLSYSCFYQNPHVGLQEGFLAFTESKMLFINTKLKFSLSLLSPMKTEAGEIILSVPLNRIKTIEKVGRILKGIDFSTLSETLSFRRFRKVKNLDEAVRIMRDYVKSPERLAVIGYCTYCGVKNEPNVIQCGFCGAPIRVKRKTL